ncbi:MAG: HAMP domain-containing sensor histidine kinase [Ruthenibacterium sp.]
MIQRLRRRMTLMMSTLTSLVLLCALCLSFSMAQTQYKSNLDALTKSNVSILLDQLASGEAIADSWLAEQEMKSLSIIAITDNGTPLHFKGAWLPRTPRDILLQRCGEAAARLSADSEKTLREKNSVQFTVPGDAGESYRVSMARLQKKAGQTVQLLVLQDSAAMTRHLRGLLLLYGIIALLGAVLLTAIGWVLSGVAARPTAQAIRQQNEFVAAASHELRSPLTVIKASLAAADTPKTPPEKAQGFLRTAQNEADRMTRLLEDLLLLAGGDAQALRAQKSAVAADTFCIELYEKFHLPAQSGGHVLTVALPDAPLPCVQADKQRLTQLFSILLSNAIEYTPRGAPIEIAARADKKCVQISVIDHGSGIADADKGKVFSRFYRADESRCDKTHFGLGLSVAAQLAAMHGSALRLTDTKGGGCTFALALEI